MTEKWQQLTASLFEIMDSSACSINEQQIAVAGGENSQGRLMDIVQIYDIRENSWRLFDICLSSPRRLVTMISSQKDRAIIIGGSGEEESKEDDTVVEEIDFLKRNLVTLPQTKLARKNGNAFMVNDSLYVFGGNPKAPLLAGEKYSLSENKWREVRPKNMDPAHKTPTNFVTGPATLLYE